jgi:hypothetical protein
MPHRVYFLALLALTGFIGQSFGQTVESTEAPAAKAPPAVTTITPEDGYTRLVETGEASGHFDTAIVTLKDEAGREVDLVGVVHIGDAVYYRRLNKRLATYESVLYEMVKPKGVQVRPGESSGSVLTSFQRSLTNLLDLSYQLDGIDYAAKNFVHADITPSRMSELLEERGASLWTIFFELMTQQLSKMHDVQAMPQPNALELLGAIFSKDRASKLKMIFGRVLGDIETAFSGLGSTTFGEVIVTERNKEALRVLDERLEAGDKRLAIFYGAAHMPDIEARLVEKGFKRDRVRWMTAWKIGAPAPASQPTRKRV